MKKIMFNDKYKLTQAVLEGRKTQTRRIAYIGNPPLLIVVFASKRKISEGQLSFEELMK